MKKNKDDHITSFEDLYFFVAEAESPVSQVLTGNLAVEFLLRKLIAQYDHNLAGLAHKLSHANLIQLAQDIGVISTFLVTLLLKANSLRNKFAHHFGYKAEVEELVQLFQLASKSTSDYAEMIDESLKTLMTAAHTYELENRILAELFLAIIYDLHQKYLLNGGNEEDLKGSCT